MHLCGLRMAETPGIPHCEMAACVHNNYALY